MRNWQPIETAPKDGTPVDLWVVTEYSDGRPSFARREADCEWRDFGEGGMWLRPGGEHQICEYYVELSGPTYESTATHWMPRPGAPT